MNNLQVFLTTHIVKKQNGTPPESNILYDMGDMCLSPIRYLFNGKNVSIIHKENIAEVLHVSSYKNGLEKKRNDLTTYSKSLQKTVVAIICLIPGLLLGSIFKAASYYRSPILFQNHKLIKNHFTPRNLTIGSEKHRRWDGYLPYELRDIGKDPLHQKIHALIIYTENLCFLGTKEFSNLYDLFPCEEPEKIIWVPSNLANGHHGWDIYAKQVTSIQQALNDTEKYSDDNALLSAGMCIPKEYVVHVET